MSDIMFRVNPSASKSAASGGDIVERDGWLFVTGQLATDPDDDTAPVPAGIEAQTRKVMDNVQRALAGTGTGLDDVVFVRIYLTHFERDFPAMNEIYKSYFPSGAQPGRTMLGVPHLARGGVIEIDLVARRG